MVKETFADKSGPLYAAAVSVLEGVSGSVETFTRLLPNAPLIDINKQLQQMFTNKDMEPEVFDQIRDALHHSISDDAADMHNAALSKLVLAGAYRATDDYDVYQETIDELELDVYHDVSCGVLGIGAFQHFAPHLESLDEAQQYRLADLLSQNILKFTSMNKPSEVRTAEYMALLKPFEKPLLGLGRFETEKDMLQTCRDALYSYLTPDASKPAAFEASDPKI